MAFSHIVSQMLVLTLLIVLGFYAGKRGIMDENLNTNVEHLYCLGDSSGWTRGLMMASVMGVFMGRKLI